MNINVQPGEKCDAHTRALASVKPVYFQIAKGEPIIKEGEPVNEDM